VNDEKYIGLDVHQATIVVAVMDSTGKLVMESILETEAATILQFFAGLRGTLSVTFEEGTWSVWLYDLLNPHVDKLVVCNPRKPASWQSGHDTRQASSTTERGLDVAEISPPSGRGRSIFLTSPFIDQPLRSKPRLQRQRAAVFTLEGPSLSFTYSRSWRLTASDVTQVTDITHSLVWHQYVSLP
jgi:hypothetical protein